MNIRKRDHIGAGTGIERSLPRGDQDLGSPDPAPIELPGASLLRLFEEALKRKEAFDAQD